METPKLTYRMKAVMPDGKQKVFYRKSRSKFHAVLELGIKYPGVIVNAIDTDSTPPFWNKKAILVAVLTAIILAACVYAASASTSRDSVPGFILPKLEQPKYNWWRAVAIAGIGFIGGTSWGVHETSVHKPWNFPDNWDPQWWDASKSWTNKYKNGDPALGAKYPGSNTWFVFLSDAKHLSATGHRASLLAGGIMVGVTIGQKKPWDHILVDAIMFAIGYAIGFNLAYTKGVWY